jgi:glycine hydroxymethyltransferase
MKEAEMRQVAALIDRALQRKDDEAALAKIKGEVRALAEAFPLYGLPARSKSA